MLAYYKDWGESEGDTINSINEVRIIESIREVANPELGFSGVRAKVVPVRAIFWFLSYPTGL